MGIFGRMLKAVGIEGPWSLSTTTSIYSPRTTDSGVVINDESALRLSAFWACLRLRSSTIGALPVMVYRRNSQGHREVARDERIYSILHDRPNADQTPVDYFEGLMVSLILRGNHFARKLKLNGEIIGLDPINPSIMNVRRKEDGSIGYRWTQDGQSFDLDENDVLHIRGFGGGPLGGLSTVAYAAESLGLAISADRAAAKIFKNGVSPSGVLKFKSWLDAEKREYARAEIAKNFAGSQNAGTPFVLEGDSSFEAITMKADDAQLLESRAWSVEEICRWHGVPPFMIGHTQKTTSFGSGVEQQLLGFQKFSLNHDLCRIEQSLTSQLLTAKQRAQGMQVKFNLDGLFRADSKARAEFYRTLTQIGAMTINEVREKENLPPLAGGDVPRIQAQNIPLSETDATIGE